MFEPFDATGDATAATDVTAVLEHGEVIPHAVGGADLERLPDLAHGRRAVELLDGLGDEVEHPFLHRCEVVSLRHVNLSLPVSLSPVIPLWIFFYLFEPRRAALFGRTGRAS